MSDKVIELDNVTVSYGPQTALEGVTLSVDKGDVVGVVGPNGGGKTTLMNAILGNIPASKGTIRLFGEDIRRFKDFHRIGYVSQNAIQFDPLFPATVREIVALGCISRTNLGRRLRDEDRRQVERAIEMVNLRGLEDRKISQLSGGQKQRIFIAKALVRRPELLLLDEATAGLDVCIQDKFINLIRQLKQEMDVTVMTVSHDLSGVICQANRLFVVNRQVWTEDIGAGTDPTKTLRQAYGQHFTFMYHSHDHYPITIEGSEEGAK